MKEESRQKSWPKADNKLLEPEILAKPELFLKMVEQSLMEADLDYEDKIVPVGKSHLAAGILLLLDLARENHGDSEGGCLRFVFVKRSLQVPQGGDLCSPGGILSPFRDKVLGRLVTLGILPVFSRQARRRLTQRSGREASLVALFAANALRETWEEIGLSPWKVRLLGALPTYSLSMFSRTIFPLLGVLSAPVVYRLNYEGEKIVTIPVEAFLKPENYGTLVLRTPEKKAAGKDEYPCFLCPPENGQEVLWGATYQMTTAFLRRFFTLPQPKEESARRVVKIIDRSYLEGNGAGRKGKV